MEERENLTRAPQLILHFCSFTCQGYFHQRAPREVMPVRSSSNSLLLFHRPLGCRHCADQQQPQQVSQDHHERLRLDQKLEEAKIKQFEAVARSFAELESVEEIFEWNEHVAELLDGKGTVAEYLEWSMEYFRPAPCLHLTTLNRPGSGRSDFRSCLRRADWNIGNKFSDVVVAMLQYGNRLQNWNLFLLGTLQGFNIMLQLGLWSIEPPRTDSSWPQGVKRSETRAEVLGLQYRSVEDASDEIFTLFFPLSKSNICQTLSENWPS